MSTISAGTTLTTALVQTGDTTGDLVIKTGSSNTTAMTISGTDQSISLATPLPVASGGTGASNLSSITNSVLPSQTGNSGKYLTTDGANSSWATVTQTRISGGTTGLTPSTLTSGDVTLAGTLAVANGGTGTSTPAIVAGTGISVSGSFPNQTITNSGVTSVSAGTGISVSAGTGGVTITNSSPNQLTTTTGSPAYYGLRAWVSFAGSSGTRNGNVNVSSVTRNGTGYYTVNFSTAMPDTAYTMAGAGKIDSGNADNNSVMVGFRRVSGGIATGSAAVACTSYTNSALDPETVTLLFAR